MSLPLELSDEFLRGIYNPNDPIPTQHLNEYVVSQNVEEVKYNDKLLAAIKESEGKLKETQSPAARPLTPEEAMIVDEQIGIMLTALIETKERIGRIKTHIDNKAIEKNVAFSLDIDNKLALRRAVRIMFGNRTNTITYSMYKEALEAKRTLEKQEANDYVKGL